MSSNCFGVLEIHHPRIFCIKRVGLNIAVCGECVWQDNRTIGIAHRALVLSRLSFEIAGKFNVHFILGIVFRAPQVILIAAKRIYHVLPVSHFLAAVR